MAGCHRHHYAWHRLCTTQLTSQPHNHTHISTVNTSTQISPLWTESMNPPPHTHTQTPPPPVHPGGAVCMHVRVHACMQEAPHTSAERCCLPACYVFMAGAAGRLSSSSAACCGASGMSGSSGSWTSWATGTNGLTEAAGYQYATHLLLPAKAHENNVMLSARMHTSTGHHHHTCTECTYITAAFTVTVTVTVPDVTVPVPVTACAANHCLHHTQPSCKYGTALIQRSTYLLWQPTAAINPPYLHV